MRQRYITWLYIVCSIFLLVHNIVHYLTHVATTDCMKQIPVTRTTDSSNQDYRLCERELGNKSGVDWGVTSREQHKVNIVNSAGEETIFRERRGSFLEKQ